MAIFEITSDRIRPIDETSFGAAGVHERGDLQRLLCNQIEVISPDTLVIAEEYSEWEDSKRRIDLLGLDKDANLIVIELKRTEDGGYMELQAIRYAAMVSPLTFEKVVEIYTKHLRSTGGSNDARTAILEFLEWDEPDEDNFAQEVHIVLASAEFSKELTTAVMWLNDSGLDIRCIRIKPYQDNGRVLVDVQQIIPLPEAAAYQVQIREKADERKKHREDSGKTELFRRFWSSLLERCKGKTGLHSRLLPSTKHWLGVRANSCMLYSYVLGKKTPRVELYIFGNAEHIAKDIFTQIEKHKIDIENRFGATLDWDQLDDRIRCRICSELDNGSVKNEGDWPRLQDEMISRMIRLEGALRPVLEGLNL